MSGSAAGIFLIGTLAAYWASRKPFTTRFESDLTAQTKLFKEVVEKFDESSKHVASQLIGVLKGKFPDGIDVDRSKTLEVGAERVPVLKSGGTVVNNSFAQVDALTRETGDKSVATIFVRRGDELKNLIHKIRILKTGYGFVIDSSGNAVVHPTLEGRNILAAKDGDGHEIIEEFVKVKSGVVGYSWINKELGETRPRQKIAVLDYYKPWDWIIATTSYTDELYGELRALRNILFALSVLGAAIVSLIAYLSIRKALSPMAAVSEAMVRIGQGDATSEVDAKLCQRADEIGTLALATNAMSTSLRGLLRDISQSVVSLSGASSKLTEVSGQTARGVAKVSERATTVAAAAEEASANTSGVAKSVGEATADLLSVSAEDFFRGVLSSRTASRYCPSRKRSPCPQ